jgi:hypothetical protein
MSTGHKPRLRGVKLDKSGKRIVFDPKSLDASKQAKLKGQKIRIGRRGK